MFLLSEMYYANDIAGEGPGNKKALSQLGTEIFCGATQIAGCEPAALSYAITYALLDNGQSAVDY